MLTCTHTHAHRQTDRQTDTHSYTHMMYLCVGYCRVRELTAGKIGTLLRISGQVVRAHPVHPELVLGHFRCVECQGEVPAIEQQFKYTQVRGWEGVDVR